MVFFVVFRMLGSGFLWTAGRGGRSGLGVVVFGLSGTALTKRFLISLTWSFDLHTFNYVVLTDSSDAGSCALGLAYVKVLDSIL